jgi:hypothetical protein
MRRTRLLFFIIIAVTAAIVIASRFVMTVRPAHPQEQASPDSQETLVVQRGQAKLPDFRRSASESRLAAQVQDVLPIYTSIGSIYFVGEIRNTGDEPLAKPEVIISLRDRQEQNLRFEAGYPVHDVIAPHVSVPVVVLFTDPPSNWHSFEVYIQAEAATGREFMAYTDLIATEIDMSQDEFGHYILSGTVMNSGDAKAEFVQTVAALYGNDKRIVGVGSAYVEKSTLDPGASSSFAVRVMNVADKPVSYRVQFVGHAN